MFSDRVNIFIAEKNAISSCVYTIRSKILYRIQLVSYHLHTIKKYNPKWTLKGFHELKDHQYEITRI